MTKREARKALREEISRLVESGLPVPARLIRLARTQGGLKGVTPRFMVYQSTRGGDHFIALREDGITCVKDFDEIHDMWRSQRTVEDRVSRTWQGSAGTTAEDEAELASLAELRERSRGEWQAKREALFGVTWGARAPRPVVRVVQS